MKRSPLLRSAGSSSVTPQASGSTNQNRVGTCFSQKEIKTIQETILKTSCGPLSWRLSFPLCADVLVGAWLVEAHLSYDPGHISPPLLRAVLVHRGTGGLSFGWWVSRRSHESKHVIVTSARWDHSRDPFLLTPSFLLPAVTGFSLWRT